MAPGHPEVVPSATSTTQESTNDGTHRDPDPTPLEKGDSKVLDVQDLQDRDPYARLSPLQAAILKEQVASPDVKVGFTTLYRYASRNDFLILFIGAISAIGAGAALSLMTVIFGSLAGAFQGFSNGETSSKEFTHEMGNLALYFVYLAIGVFVLTYSQTVAFIYTGEHVCAKIREHYLESCLKQNMGYFDKLNAGEVTTRITVDATSIQDGISEKIGLTISAVGTFVTAFVIGFIQSWKLTLILTSTLAALVLLMGGVSSFIVKYSKQNADAYAEGGSVAGEVIGSIRNAIAYGTQDRLAKKYDVHLTKAEYYGFRLKSAMGIMMGGMTLIICLNYGLAFWMGSRYLVDGSVPLSKILTIMMSVLMGSIQISNVAPNLQAITTALGAAAKIYNTIDRTSPLDPTSDEGAVMEKLKGHLRLENVQHIYPSRPDVVVMESVTLDIPAGRTTALVGESGSGKSSVLGLIERFYKPVAGQVLLDGVDISTLNLRWLRRQMSLVSQEPTLFGTTIYENIRYGLIGTKWEDESEEKQRELVLDAAKKANAHLFVDSLPEGYQTRVDQGGFLLSGGQLQRIAIARAVVSDPKILLLDESTSALDTRSEKIVQAALEAVCEGRTTVTVAHRLSTVRNAHNIVVMSKGAIVEQGTHNELLERKGTYFNLATAQAIAAMNESTTEAEEAMDSEEEKMLIRQTSGQDMDGFDAKHDVAARLQRSTTSRSASLMASTGRQQDKEPRYSLWALIKLIASHNREEWHLMLIGAFCSIITGGGSLAYAVLFGKLIGSMSVPVSPETIPQILSEVSFWALMFVVLGLVTFLAFSVQGIVFAKTSERLIHRVRDKAFRSMLRQDVEFFDGERNSPGALTCFLGIECTHVAGLSGTTLGTILSMITLLISSMALGLALGWKLALVCISTIPVLLICGFLRFWLLAGFQQRAKTAYEESASQASEAITAIRTVASLTREHHVLGSYKASLDAQQRTRLKSVLRSSALFAMSSSFEFLAFALGFWYGGMLVAKREYALSQFFVVFPAIIFSSQSAGAVFSFAPDMGKAAEASRALRALFDRTPTIDTWSADGEKLEAVEGNIEFRDVHFRYPTRPQQPVLRGLNLSIDRGQYVALVGASGCGKSTTLALLERFYDPLAGGIFIDGKDISSLNVNQYRSFIALVSQEPTLYQGTIRENILLGAPKHVSDAQVELACREANIFDLILSLPDGMNTIVGSKGTLLSRGQRQRLSIARALIRDPKILLLDEATSALDSASEHLVQEALNRLAEGRTTVAVAHRLSTIQKADIIYVFDQGRIVEQGRHAELMKQGGRYAELVNLQSLEKHE